MRYLLLVLLLAGCATPMQSPYDQAWDNCRDYGYAGTPNMAPCLERETARIQSLRAGLAMQYMATRPVPVYQPVPFTPMPTQPATYTAPTQCRSVAGVWTCQ